MIQIKKKPVQINVQALNNSFNYYLCSSALASVVAASVVAAVESVVATAVESAAGVASTATAVSVAGAASSVLEDEHEVAKAIAATAKVTLNKFFILLVIIINNVPLIPSNFICNPYNWKYLLTDWNIIK